MKILKVAVLCIGTSVIAALIGPYLSRWTDSAPRELRGVHDANVSVASDKAHFKLEYEFATAYNYVHNRPKSKEDQRELARSAELQAYAKLVPAMDKADKDGSMISVPSGTRCDEIQRLRFTGPRLFPGDYVGIQVRILEGPRKGFEGWVFDSQVHLK